MRFNDLLSTVHMQPTDNALALEAVWMQIVDILAQNRPTTDEAQRLAAFARLKELRKHIPVDRRQAVAASLASRKLPVDLVALFGSDAPVVAAPLMATLQLSTEEWRDVLPQLSAPARSLLRERRDLAPEVQAMLSGFGSSDMALPQATTPQRASDPASVIPTPQIVEPFELGTQHEVQPSAVVPVVVPQLDPLAASAPMTETVQAKSAGPVQISDLVTRIEAYRRDNAKFGQPSKTAEPGRRDANGEFRFEAGADGVVTWVDGANPGPIVGINLGLMAEPGEHGVDGHAAGAFRKRTPFRDARLTVPGAGTLSGTWLISGTPWFNSLDGRFQGFRCTARRPLREENLTVPQGGLLGDGLPPDSVRQLVHELRTPLNAIRGFAEMIHGQLLGSVARPYRDRAQAIIDDARRLLTLFDDLDSAARLDREQPFVTTSGPTDARRLLHNVAANLASLTDARNVHLRVSSGSNEAILSIDSVSVERMYARLLSTVLGLAQNGETISASLSEAHNMVMLAVDRPASLRGLREADMFDPSYGPAGDWPDAPALGLGFALRLIKNMARAAGGRLLTTDDEFILRLPLNETSASNGRTN